MFPVRFPLKKTQTNQQVLLFFSQWKGFLPENACLDWTFVSVRKAKEALGKQHTVLPEHKPTIMPKIDGKEMIL